MSRSDRERDLPDFAGTLVKALEGEVLREAAEPGTENLGRVQASDDLDDLVAWAVQRFDLKT